MNPKSILTVLIAVTLIAPYAIAGDDGSELLSIQDFIDVAVSGDAVLIQASPSGAPNPESLTIGTDGLTICSVPYDADGERVSLGSPQECGASDEDVTANTIIDSSTIAVAGAPATTVLTIEADDVVVQGLTLRWTVQYAEEILGTDGSLLPSGPNMNPTDLVAQTQKGLSGIVVDGDNVTIADNMIQMRGGPCAAGASPCNTPTPTAGVNIAPNVLDTDVSNNAIEVSVRADEGTVAGDVGILASGTDYTIADNLFRYWAGAGVRVTEFATGAGLIADNAFEINALYGVHVQHTDAVAAPVIDNNSFRNNGEAAILLEGSDAVVVSNNGIQPGLAAPMTGVWVQGADDVRILGNTFSPLAASPAQPGFGVTVSTFAGNAANTPENLVLRDNTFDLTDALTNQYALTVTPDVQTTNIDARLNDWGVYSWGQVSARVLDAGVTNTVQILPYVEE